MSEQANHTDRSQTLKTDVEWARGMKAQGEELLQAFLDFVSECNKAGVYLDWKAVPVNEFKQIAQIRVLIDPERRRYD